MKRILFFASVMFLLITSGCKKDESCSLSSTSILGTYKLTGATYKATSSSASIDAFALWETCMKDNTLTISSNNTYAFTDAGVVCTDDVEDSGSWSLSGTTLTLDGTESSTISDFNCDHMSMKVTDWDVAGDEITMVFTRQ